MRSFFIKLFIIIASLVIVDFFVGCLGDWIILKQAEKCYTGDTAHLNYCLNGAKEDIIILGSSEAACAYIPALISERLFEETGKEYSVFNAGTTNQRISYCYCVEQGLIERNKPKVLVLDLVWNYLNPINDDMNNTMMSPLRPYSAVNPYVEDLLNKNDGKKERLISHCNMYRFNSEIIKYFTFFTKDKVTDGYICYNNKLPLNSIKQNEACDDNSIVQSAVDDFECFITLAEENDVKVVCTVTPKFRIMPTTCNSYQTMLKICAEHNIPVCEIYKDSIFDNPLLYYNDAHLNKEGAILSTNILIDTLNEILK